MEQIKLLGEALARSFFDREFNQHFDLQQFGWSGYVLPATGHYARLSLIYQDEQIVELGFHKESSHSYGTNLAFVKVVKDGMGSYAWWLPQEDYSRSQRESIPYTVPRHEWITQYCGKYLSTLQVKTDQVVSAWHVTKSGAYWFNNEPPPGMPSELHAIHENGQAVVKIINQQFDIYYNEQHWNREILQLTLLDQLYPAIEQQYQPVS